MYLTPVLLPRNCALICTVQPAAWVSAAPLSQRPVSVSNSHQQPMREVLHITTIFLAPEIWRTGLQRLVRSTHLNRFTTQKKPKFSVVCCWASRFSHFTPQPMEQSSMRWRGWSGHWDTAPHCSLISTVDVMWPSSCPCDSLSQWTGTPY